MYAYVILGFVNALVILLIHLYYSVIKTDKKAPYDLQDFDYALITAVVTTLLGYIGTGIIAICAIWYKWGLSLLNKNL